MSSSSTAASGPAGLPAGCPFSGMPSGADARTVPVPPTGGQHRLPDLDTHKGDDGVALARVVTELVRRTGKHFVPEPVLAQLAGLRQRPISGDPYLAAFLDCLLDKHDGRLHNRTYLALALLERLLDDPRSGLDPERMSALLMADVIRHEIAAERVAPHRGGDDDRPAPRTLRRRLQHATRFVAHCRGTTGSAGLRRRPVLPEECSQSDLLDGLPTPAGPAAEWLAMTVQPVYVLHDEYFFIRALQCHEMIFTGLADDIRGATRAVREGSFEAVVARLDRANVVLERAALLFRIVATMQIETFSAFREFTQGASAIQSEQYKRFEISCGEPRPTRLRSDAFAGVPAVAAEVAGGDTLSRAYLDARRDAAFAPGEWRVLDAALGALEVSHQRWKTAHHGLAARMLGDASGSGYTAGVPYLRRCISNRLFWQLADGQQDGGRRPSDRHRDRPTAA